MITVRQLHPTRWQVFRDLRLASLRDDPQAFGSTHEAEQVRDRADWMADLREHAWFAVTEADQPVGIAGGRQSWDGILSERDLIGMWVRPTHRRRGLSTHLLSGVRGWAEGQGADTLALWVTNGNTAARSAYVKHGFTYVRSAPFQRDPRITAHKLTMSLSNAELT